MLTMMVTMMMMMIWTCGWVDVWMRGSMTVWMCGHLLHLHTFTHLHIFSRTSSPHIKRTHKSQKHTFTHVQQRAHVICCRLYAATIRYMVYDIWFLILDIRYTMCAVWCVTYDVTHVQRDTGYLKCDSWCTMYRVWSIIYDMIYDVSSLISDI